MMGESGHGIWEWCFRTAQVRQGGKDETLCIVSVCFIVKQLP